MLSSQLSDLNLKSKRELSEQDVSILLYHICKQFDLANSYLPAVVEASADTTPDAAGASSPRGIEERNALRTKVCIVA